MGSVKDIWTRIQESVGHMAQKLSAEKGRSAPKQQ
jgi:hypothetical protein